MMALIKYLGIDETIKFIEKNNFDESLSFLSPKEKLERAIKEGLLNPLFRFEGYIYKNYHKHEMAWRFKGIIEDNYFYESNSLPKHWLKELTSPFSNLSNDYFILDFPSWLVYEVQSYGLLFKEDESDSEKIEKGVHVYLFSKNEPKKEWIDLIDKEHDLIKIDRSDVLFEFEKIKNIFLDDVPHEKEKHLILQATIDSQAQKIIELEQQVKQLKASQAKATRPQILK